MKLKIDNINKYNLKIDIIAIIIHGIPNYYIRN